MLSAWLSPAGSSRAPQTLPIRSRHPGVRISLEPPKGFVIATTFTGFLDQPDNASILLAEFPPVAFNQFRNGFTADAMAKHGMRLLSNETIDGVPYEQITVRAEQRVGNQIFDKWLMTINGPDVVGMVTVSIAKPAPPRLSDAVIRAALASVRINATASVDPIAALPFSIEPTARFKYRKPLAGRGLLLKGNAASAGGTAGRRRLHRHSRRRNSHCAL